MTSGPQRVWWPAATRRIGRSVMAGVLLLAGCAGGRTTDGTSTLSPTTASTTALTTVPTSSVDSEQTYCRDSQPCIPQSLWRPLKIPSLRPGEACPTSRIVQHPAGRPIVRGAGDGPVYAGPYAPLDAFAIQLPPAPDQLEFAGSAWGGAKVLWHADPTYRGPVLIRGRQLDGLHLVRFERGKVPPAELMFPAAPGSGWRHWPSYTRIEAPGCYAWQVDSDTLTELIIFKAIKQIRAGPPRPDRTSRSI
jgi:hypothetical protein